MAGNQGRNVVHHLRGEHFLSDHVLPREALPEGHSMRYWLCLACLALLPLSLLAQVPSPATQTGTVKGIAKFDDGVPCRELPGTLRIGETTLAFSTGKDGTFVVVAPVGQGTVSVMSARMPVTTTAGVQTSVQVTVKLTGVVLTVTHANKTPADVTVNAVYRTPDGERAGLRVFAIAPGRFWYPDVPAEATGFAAMATEHVTGIPPVARQQWLFDDPKPVQHVVLSLDPAVPVTLAVLDRVGQPLRNQPVIARVSYQVPTYEDAFWDAQPARMTVEHRTLYRLAADDTGKVVLGAWRPGAYEVALRIGTHTGSAVPVTVAADGTVSRTQYTADAGRVVTQVVFDGNRHPVANALVTASYCWQGVMCLARATTDAAGKVVWDDLPRVRVIVWGTGLPAGVLPADTLAVTEPLPAPVPGEAHTFTWITGEAPVTPTFLTGLSRPDGALGIGPSQFTATVPGTAGRQAVECGTETLTAGTPFSLVAVLYASPPRVAVLNGVYAPYCDGAAQVEFPLPFHDGVEIRGRFATRTQQAVPGVSRLEVLPTQVDEAMPWGDDVLVPSLGLLHPAEHPDGSFTILAASPGVYRLCVDFFDATTPPTEDLLVPVRVGVNDVVVTLPDPLATVPAGTDLCALTFTAPTITRHLAVGAQAPLMPVFGPRDRMLALWYHPTPNQLAVWTAPELRLPPRTFTLRTAYLEPRDGDGQPYREAWRLLPLWPTSYLTGWQALGSTGDHGETSPITFADGTRYRADLWPGKYLVSTGSGLFAIGEAGRPASPGTIEVPDRAQAILPVPLGSPVAAMPGTTRTLLLDMSKSDADRLGQTGLGALCVSTDVITPDGLAVLKNDAEDGLSPWTCTVPVGATRLTFRWLGVGVLRDLPVPTATLAHLTLQGWQAGQTVSGQVLTSAGTSWSNGRLLVEQTGWDGATASTLIRTDAEGRFTLAGVLPGTLFLYPEGREKPGWSIDVPEAGVANLILRFDAHPARLTFGHGGDRQQLWWFPASGKPVKLPTGSWECALQDAPRGDGVLWQVDGDRGYAQYVRYRFGDADTPDHLPERDTGPSVGLLFPLDAKAGLPGAVTLIGQGERAGVNVLFRNFFWQPSTLLGQVVGQIGAVPPGAYRLIIETSRGKVESGMTVGAYGTSVRLTFPPEK